MEKEEANREGGDAEAVAQEQPKMTTQRHRALVKQPLALQWFEDGMLKKRSDEERQAGRFELFLDLLYVAILASFAHNLADHPSGDQLVKYILILAMSWHIWSDLRELMNSFYNDDIPQRLLILWIMAVLVLYGNNAVIVEKSIGAMRSAVGAYMVARLSANTAHLFYSFASYHHRAQQRLWFVLAFFALLIYIPLFVEGLSFRSKIAVAATGIVVEELIWIFCYSPLAKRLLGARFTTAVDVAHEIDRFAAFFIIVLGEFLYLIIVGHPTGIGFNDNFLRAIWTLIIAFCLNWLYVHNDGALESKHALSHSSWTAFTWVTLHLPLVAGLLVGGHVAALSASEEGAEFHHGELWLMCGGLGVGLLCLYAIALLHRSDDDKGVLLLPKPARLILRPIIGITIICLPLAHHLNITQILSIIMALIVLCVMWENVTSLIRGARAWEKWVVEETRYPKIDAGAAAQESRSSQNEKRGGEDALP